MRRMATWVTPALLAAWALLAVHTVTSLPLPALMGAGSFNALLGCIGCGGVGAATLFASRGALAWLLWTKAGFTAGMACLSVCVAAVT
jgi:hypothetical protein